MRKYSPTGDRLSQHIQDARASIDEADVDLTLLIRRLKQANQHAMAGILTRQVERLRCAQRHLTAAEAIRSELSARRQAALSREANKRRAKK